MLSTNSWGEQCAVLPDLPVFGSCPARLFAVGLSAVTIRACYTQHKYGCHQTPAVYSCFHSDLSYTILFLFYYELSRIAMIQVSEILCIDDAGMRTQRVLSTIQV